MRIRLLALVVVSGAAAFVFGQDHGAPKGWIDPDTGHRVVRLADEPGSASLYFNQNGYTADGKKLVYTTPNSISTYDFATQTSKRVVEGRVRIIEAGHKTQNVYYVTDGAVWATERELLARSEVGGLPLEYVWTGLRARG